MLYGPINIDKEIMGGAPVFRGTRVPIQILFDYIEGGDSIEDFLDNYPHISESLVMEVLNLAENFLQNENFLNESFA